ncbi:MAG: hypothetical protein MK185_04685 [Saccharospirillaceae bacterium]|nr:hypothetical protein [Saccharospirillaceae bacterium]
MKGKGLKVYARVVVDESAAPSKDDSDYVRVKGIKSFAPGDQTVNTQEDTTLDPEDNVIGHTAGMVEPGEATFGYKYVESGDPGQQLVAGSLGKVLDIKVEWVDDSIEIHRGTLTKKGGSEASEEELQKSYSLKRKLLPVEIAAGA